MTFFFFGWEGVLSGFVAHPRKTKLLFVPYGMTARCPVRMSRRNCSPENPIEFTFYRAVECAQKQELASDVARCNTKSIRMTQNLDSKKTCTTVTVARIPRLGQTTQNTY